MRLALLRVVCPLGRSAVHLGNITSSYILGNLCKGFVVRPCQFTLEVINGGVMILWQIGNHGSWVKCATSTECYETDISVVLTVMSGLGSSFD
jgi:hypothetical protein